MPSSSIGCQRPHTAAMAPMPRGYFTRNAAVCRTASMIRIAGGEPRHELQLDSGSVTLDFRRQARGRPIPLPRMLNDRGCPVG
jgi:hypothetical protein